MRANLMGRWLFVSWGFSGLQLLQAVPATDWSTIRNLAILHPTPNLGSLTGEAHLRLLIH